MKKTYVKPEARERIIESSQVIMSSAQTPISEGNGRAAGVKGISGINVPGNFDF